MCISARDNRVADLVDIILRIIQPLNSAPLNMRRFDEKETLRRTKKRIVSFVRENKQVTNLNRCFRLLGLSLRSMVTASDPVVK